MDKLFLTILNMSLTGAFVIAAVCAARMALQKAPKAVSYGLWAVAGFRLLFPFSVESVFSLIPFNGQTIPMDIATQPMPRIESGISVLNSAVSSVLPAASPQTSVNPLQVWIAVGAAVWLVGAVAMLAYGVVSYLLLKRRLWAAALVDGNVYEADSVQSPFVLGLLHPRVYLPVGLPESEKEYILLHEQTHIKRRDHIVKFAAYCILSVHWFNPLAWVAFVLMGADMEMSCDERVLRELGAESKKDYSRTLVSLAVGRRVIAGSPLAFGEGGIQARVRNILRYRHTPRILLIAAVALAAAVGIALATNRAYAPYGEVVNIPLGISGVEFATGLPAYSPDFTEIRVRLTNYDAETLMCGEMFRLAQRIGGEWREVPFREDIGFNLIGIMLAQGQTKEYVLTPDMLPGKLKEGDYCFFTDVWFGDGESERENIIPTALFSIQKSAPADAAKAQQRLFMLENITDKQRMERMIAVTLNTDGTAHLSTPPISSYAIVDPVYYTYEGDELLLHYGREVSEEGMVAKFKVIDERTLEFARGYVTLFPVNGGRYVLAQTELVGQTLSPDGKYSMEGLSMESGAKDGTYTIKQVQIREVASGEIVWFHKSLMFDLSFQLPFVWSADGAYVYYAYGNSAYADTGVVRVSDKTVQWPLTTRTLKELVPPTTPDEAQLELQSTPLSWEGHKLLISASWRVKEKTDDGQNRVYADMWFDADTGAFERRNILTAEQIAIRDRLYLGMTRPLLAELLGERDGEGSGMDFWIYEDVGVFYFGHMDESSGEAVVTIAQVYGEEWNTIKWITEAAKLQCAFDLPEGFVSCTYETEESTYDEKGFTVRVNAQLEVYQPDGDYDVKFIGGIRQTLVMRFGKHPYNGYSLLECTPVGKPSTDVEQSQGGWMDAMYHFVGAIPSTGRYGVEEITIVVTNVAEDTVEDETFVLRLAPEAKLTVESNEADVSQDKAERLKIAYVNGKKSTPLGAKGTETTITVDMQGIYDEETGLYRVLFEPYEKPE